MGGKRRWQVARRFTSHPGPPPSQLILVDIRQSIGRLQLNLAMPDLEDVILLALAHERT